MESLTTSVKDIQECVIEMNKELSPTRPGTNINDIYDYDRDYILFCIYKIRRATDSIESLIKHENCFNNSVINRSFNLNKVLESKK